MGKRVLVVLNDCDLKNTYAAYLQQDGHSVDFYYVNEEHEILAVPGKLSSRKYDCVVVDDMDGLGIKAIMNIEKNPDLRKFPVIGASGSNMTAAVMEAAISRTGGQGTAILKLGDVSGELNKAIAELCPS